MEIIRKEKFMELARKEDDHLISLCIPTHSHGQEVNEKQDSLALKSALKSVTNRSKNSLMTHHSGDINEKVLLFLHLKIFLKNIPCPRNRNSSPMPVKNSI